MRSAGSGADSRGCKLKRITQLHLSSHYVEAKQRDEALLKVLRKAALSARSCQLRPFYSIREVASHFHLSPTPVSRVFDQLKAEGVLRSNWGSKTRIEAVHLDRHLQVRGLTALLLPFSFLMHEEHCWQLILQLSAKLWQLRFATRLHCYKPNETAPCERMIAETPDVIIWLRPGGSDPVLDGLLANCPARVIRISAASICSTGRSQSGTDEVAGIVKALLG